MAISDKLRKYLQEPRTQELLNEDNLTMFLVESFSQLEYNEYIELVDILFDQYDNFFAEITDASLSPTPSATVSVMAT